MKNSKEIWRITGIAALEQITETSGIYYSLYDLRGSVRREVITLTEREAKALGTFLNPRIKNGK